MVSGTSCSLDTRQEAEYCEAVVFNGPQHSKSRERNSFNGPSDETDQQQEQNLSEHKHVRLLSAQIDWELEAKGWKLRGKDFTHCEQP